MISIDASEVRALAVDLQRAAARVPGETKQVIERAALEIKRDMQDTMRKSASFGALAGGISYDLLDGGFSAEVGPNKQSRGGKSKLGAGANIAYFGTSRGGGTVEDPIEALLREAPEVERRLSDLYGGLL